MQYCQPDVARGVSGELISLSNEILCERRFVFEGKNYKFILLSVFPVLKVVFSKLDYAKIEEFVVQCLFF